MPAARRTPPPPPSSSQADPFQPADGAGAPAAEIPEVEPRTRTPKYKKLEEAMSGIYILIGGGLATLPPQVVPMQFKAVGLSLAGSSDEIAAAWVDLAEDDPRVRKILESLTSVSGWGKVIGVHLIAVGSSVPGVAAVMPGSQQQQQQPNGAPPMDMESMMMLGELLRMAQSEQRAPEQPPQQAAPFAPPAPQEQQQQRRAPNAPPPQARPRAGMPSPADLGVTQSDVPLDFPTAGPESIRG